MLTIGEFAARTGVTRRMLRHWDETGVLRPAVVDERTGHRAYAERQIGHVGAIVELRGLDFGLDDIRELLDGALTTERLREALRERESQLERQATTAQARLAAVSSRLRSLDEDRERIQSGLRIGALPGIEGAGVSETVRLETEIPAAVGRLRALFTAPDGDGADRILVYDGTTHPDVIHVRLGIATTGSRHSPSEAFSLAAVDVGACTRFATAPASIGDAWRAIDDELAVRGFRATGPYRQISHADGAVTLATPVVADDAECAT